MAYRYKNVYLDIRQGLDKYVEPSNVNSNKLMGMLRVLLHFPIFCVAAGSRVLVYYIG